MASCRVRKVENVNAWCLPQSVGVCQGAAVVPGYTSVACARLKEVGLLRRSDVHLACEDPIKLLDQRIYRTRASEASLIVERTAY